MPKLPKLPKLPIWEDSTSYARDEARSPRAWTMHLQSMRIVVHRHRDYEPDQWLVSVYGAVSIDMAPLTSKGIDEAKDEALARVKATLIKMAEAIP